MHLLCV